MGLATERRRQRANRLIPSLNGFELEARALLSAAPSAPMHHLPSGMVDRLVLRLEHFQQRFDGFVHRLNTQGASVPHWGHRIELRAQSLLSLLKPAFATTPLPSQAASATMFSNSRTANAVSDAPSNSPVVVDNPTASGNANDPKSPSYAVWTTDSAGNPSLTFPNVPVSDPSIANSQAYWRSVVIGISTSAPPYLQANVPQITGFRPDLPTNLPTADSAANQTTTS